MIRLQISIVNRLTYQSATSTYNRRKGRTRAEHSSIKSGRPLMRALDLQNNVPNADKKLTLGLRVDFVSCRLAANELLPVNSRAITGPSKMSLLLEVGSSPALIFKPRLTLLYTRITLVSRKSQTSRDICSFKTSTRSSADQIIRQGRSCIAPQTVFHITFMRF